MKFANSLQLGRKILYEEGLFEFVQGVAWYCHRRTLRRFIPDRTRHGVKVGDSKIEQGKPLDGLFGSYSPNVYEEMYTDLIGNHASDGKTVVEVGSHLGLSPVVAAKSVGSSGRVIVVEPTQSGINNTIELARTNGVEGVIEFKQGKIGCVYNEKVEGEYDGVPNIDVGELPSCDVLAIDCDGCELTLLEKLKIRPEKIIVEHHGQGVTNGSFDFEYDARLLESILNDNGYTVIESHTKERLHEGLSDTIGYFVASQD